MKNYLKFKNYIDELIPDDKYFGMPKASKIIDTKYLFLKFQKKNLKINQNNIENLMSDEILNSYFTSEKVIKSINMKTTFLSKMKSGKTINLKLLNKVIQMKSKFRDV